MTDTCRLAKMAGVLLVGETAGFACARFSSAWPWLGAIAALLALVAYGWRLPHVLQFSVFAFGLVAAMRTDALRTDVLDGHWMSARCGAPPALVLKVEGDVHAGSRKDGGRTASFHSHLGPVPLKAVISLPDGMPLPEKGDAWRCEGWISRKTLRGGRFGCRMFWGKADAYAIRLAGASATDKRLSAISDICAANASIGLWWCPLLASINRAILLGRRSELPADRRTIFARAGTIHVFAISGMHVMLLALLLHRVLALASVPVRVRGLVALPVLAAYVMVTGMRPSAVRAAMMAGFYMLAPTFGRKGDSMAAWSLTAIVVFGHAPERLYDTGCVLSFAVMLGIVAWLRWVAPHLPYRCREGFGGECCVSAAAWFSGTPIVATVFGVFTPGGLLANLAMLRLAGYMVAFGMAGMILGFACRPAAALFNNLAAVMSLLMMLVSSAVAALPLASLDVASWTWRDYLMWYGTGIGLLAGMVAFCRCRQDRWWRQRMCQPVLGNFWYNLRHGKDALSRRCQWHVWRHDRRSAA